MVAHITLATRDVPRSVDFFQESLGWQPVARPGNIGMTAAWLEIAPGVELHLIEDPAVRAIAVRAGVWPAHCRHLSPRRVPRLKERLQAQGATLIEPMRETPFARFFFRDPNGYVFEVVEENHDEPRPIDADSTGDHRSVTADPQCIGNPVDVVKPGCDQGDLQDGAVVEASAAQPLVVQGRDLGRVLGELDHVVDHHSLCFGDRCLWCNLRAAPG